MTALAVKRSSKPMVAQPRGTPLHEPSPGAARAGDDHAARRWHASWGPSLLPYDSLHIDLRARFAPPLTGQHYLRHRSAGA